MKRWYVSAFLLAFLVLLPGTALAADGDYTYTQDADHFLTITGWSGAVDSDGRLEIPPTIDGIEVKRIGNGAFSGRTDIKYLVLPEGLQEIAGSFKYCTELETVRIPSTLTTVNGQQEENSPFYGCANLKEIEFGTGLSKIPATLFRNCRGLKKVKIPGDITIIEAQAFEDCTSLTQVEFNSNDYLTTIGDYAFSGCTSLPAIDLPEGLTTLGEHAFSSHRISSRVVYPTCVSLGSVTIPASLGRGSAASPFAGCSRLETVTFGDGIQAIVATLFHECTGLEAIEIPETVTSIGVNAFAGSGLKEITIPDNVLSYGAGAFQLCASMKGAVLSATATAIPERMFYHCYDLETVTSNGSDPVTVARDAFRECFALEDVDMKGGLATIGANAFRTCKRLKTIALGTELTSIGNYAFEQCESLPSIDLPSSLEPIRNRSPIGTNAFQNDLLLASITLPDTLTTIPSYAFANCPQLQDVTIPGRVTNIGDHAFYQDTALTRVFIPDSVVEGGIGTEAFSYIDKLTVVGYNDSYAQTWAEANGAVFIGSAARPVTSIRLASGKDHMILPIGQNVAPVFIVEPEDTTDILTLSSSSSQIMVRNGYILYSQERVERPVTITVTATNKHYEFKFKVTSDTMTGIQTAELPEVTDHAVGDTMDWTGFVPEALFEHGETEPLYNYPAEETKLTRDKVACWKPWEPPEDSGLSNPDLSSVGDHPARVTYGSFSTSFDVHVYESASEIPVSIRRVETTDDGVRVLLHGASGTVSLFAAAYTEDGKFLDMASKALSASEISAGSASLTLDTSSAATVKAFLTADTSTALRPVQTVRTLSLS